MIGKPDDRAKWAWNKRRFELLEERPIALRVEKRLSSRIEGRDPFLGNQQSEPALCPVQLRGNKARASAILVSGCSHERHVGVMNVKLPPSKLLRHRIDCAEIDHIERAQGKDIGNP